MAGELSRQRVSDLISQKVLAIGDGYRAKNSEMSLAGIPFARAGNIDGGFLFNDADLIDISSIPVPKEKLSYPGDTVFTSKGTVGRFAFVKHDTRQFVYSPQLCYWRSLDKNLIDPKYLYYWLSGPEFYAQYKGVSGQTDMAEYVSLGDQRQMWISLPDPADQTAIGEVLGLLDDKIDVNRRMAATVEEMAEAVFKSWFVDFDPVHAKVERRDPRLAADIAALFPDRFDGNGVPEGWTNAPLLQHARLISGGTPNTDELAYWDGPISWASARDVSQCPDRFLIGTERTITQKGLDESATRMVPALSTVVVARGATTGRHCLFGREMAMNQTCYALSSSNETPFWLACAFSRLVDALVRGAHGSVFDTITTTTLGTARVVDGGQALTVAFETSVAPMYRRILGLVQEASKLRTLRDTLLPKLISGELRIKDAEKAVAA
ncbi:restriction endonuclease subunit S [Mesorhizobium sp. CA16]|uniref:restriction endonuclease subunit S n=1 Tax=Mesorhizobium sp. CA16 TaxID=588496 RepID=UPI001CCC66C6|nr:restriction endonuclease subunit S [Mesorhizobium sp. CA16]MBZ9915826.1 restriction endonuclease subunit S [Mesorhizobium sp. CA16]